MAFPERFISLVFRFSSIRFKFSAHFLPTHGHDISLNPEYYDLVCWWCLLAGFWSVGHVVGCTNTRKVKNNIARVCG
jgi:hypothetical protein